MILYNLKEFVQEPDCKAEVIYKLDKRTPKGIMINEKLKVIYAMAEVVTSCDDSLPVTVEG